MNTHSRLSGDVVIYGDVWRGMDDGRPSVSTVVRHSSPYITTSPSRGHTSPSGGENAYLATVDVAAVKQSIDLLALVGSATTLRKVATTRGGEWAGPCPFCGGEDRFRVQPAQGIWFCRQCSDDGHWSDAIAYVMRRDSVPFREACERLAGGAALEPLGTTRRTVPSGTGATDAAEPSTEWREKAEAFVRRCEEALWSPAGEWARHYLRGHRGLTKETIRAWRLGWRLDPSGYATGITIPWFLDGEVWHVKTRRLNPKAETWAQAEDVE
ncbi:MAG TPA: CHC2 zinc finger domain-containing protein, partial [Chloroflexota bacterium]|nr:CHC2 zinc finger domain-containing protein [Chloroflexota bacterium]